MTLPDQARRQRNVLERVDALRDQQLQLTRDLIAISTVNPYAADDSAHIETEGQDWIADRFAALGADVRRLPVPADVYQQAGMVGPQGRRWEGRDNVVAEWTLGDGQGPTILLNDHMDTVGTLGMTIDPFDPVVEGDFLLGRGASDTKGNMVMGLTAVEAVLQEARGLRGRIVFESVVDEECDGAGAGTLACCLAGVTGDLALCLDGSAGMVVIGCQGVATARIEVRGKAGHAAGGDAVNAIDKAWRVKQAAESWFADYRRDNPTCFLNVGVFHAGSVPAVTPSQATMIANMTYPLHEAQRTLDQHGAWDGRLFREAFEQGLAQRCADDPWLADHPPAVSWVKDAYPFLCDAGDPMIRAVIDAATDATGKAPKVGPMPAWFDGCHTARRLNIPTVSLGQGLPGYAHTDAERVRISDLHAGARNVALALCRLLTPPHSIGSPL